MVLDSGDGVSHAVPVYNGFAIQNSIRRIDVAGRDVTENLQKHLRRAGYVFHTSAEKEIVRLMKEKVSYVALDPYKEEKDFHTRTARTEEKKVRYALPDGKTIEVR
jgi:centractin